MGTKSNMILYTLWTTLVLVVLATAQSNYNCIQDADCAAYSELHNFTCVETECEQKQCNCPLGKIIYSDNSTGTNNHYCVPHIPLGQPCSGDPFAGHCNVHRNVICTNNTCQCYAAWKLYTFTHWRYGNEKMCMSGNPYPAGEIRFIGTQCSADSDCSFFTNFTCVDNRCKCSVPGHVPNIDGTECRLPMQHGATCINSNEGSEHCDGTKGLVCGNTCFYSSVSSCHCDLSYRESGSSCVRATMGTSCNRDYQCKSLSRLATCESGTCAIAPGSGCLTNEDCVFVSPTAVCVVTGSYGQCQTGPVPSNSSTSSIETTSGSPCAGGGSCQSGAAARGRMDVVLALAFFLVKLLLC